MQGRRNPPTFTTIRLLRTNPFRNIQRLEFSKICLGKELALIQLVPALGFAEAVPCTAPALCKIVT